jgi:hypothetical protein
MRPALPGCSASMHRRPRTDSPPLTTSRSLAQQLHSGLESRVRQGFGGARPSFRQTLRAQTEGDRLL